MLIGAVARLDQLMRALAGIRSSARRVDAQKDFAMLDGHALVVDELTFATWETRT